MLNNLNSKIWMGKSNEQINQSGNAQSIGDVTFSLRRFWRPVMNFDANHELVNSRIYRGRRVHDLIDSRLITNLQ